MRPRRVIYLATAAAALAAAIGWADAMNMAPLANGPSWRLAGAAGVVTVVCAMSYCAWLVRPVEKHIFYAEARSGANGDEPPRPNGWFAVASLRQLVTGQARTVTLYGSNLAVFRDERGIPVVLDAHCAHLGANLGVGGEVVNGCLVCPFHGWSYDRDGKCVHIPYLGREGKIPPTAQVQSHRCLERNGIVFVWHDTEGREHWWEPPVIDGITDGSLAFRGCCTYDLNGHMQDINENGVDRAHFKAVHQYPFKYGTQLLASVFEQVVDKLEWSPGMNGDASSSVSELTYHMKICGRKCTKSRAVRAEQHGPGIGHVHWESGFGKIVVLVTSTPTAPCRVRASFTIHTDRRMPRLLARFFFWHFLSQFEQDVPIWDAKVYQRRPVLVREDGDIAGFRRWYSQFYSDRGSTAAPR